MNTEISGLRNMVITNKEDFSLETVSYQTILVSLIRPDILLVYFMIIVWLVIRSGNSNTFVGY